MSGSDASQDFSAVTGFYNTRAGLIAHRAIAARLRLLWPRLAGYRLLGFGFTQPYLDMFNAERAIAAGPDIGMAFAHPGSNLVCAEDALPFADSLFDRILLVHALERSETLRPLLRQLWRVLAPEGRMMVVAPNRASLWAQMEHTPLGQGRPFSRGELDRLLRQAMFEPLRWDHALHAPPMGTRLLVRTGAGWEKAGSLLFPALGGMHLVEARKSIYAVTPLPVETVCVTPHLASEGVSSFSEGK